jgi:RecJ-like exonuclease
MKTKCPKCKGLGSVVVDYKEYDVCGGTGYEDDAFNVGDHFKGVPAKAKARFDLGGVEDVPCEACNGKGQVEVYEDCPYCKGTGQINVCRDCGKMISEEHDLCDDCKEKRKIEKI